MTKVLVAGVGMTDFYKPGKSPDYTELGRDAALAAITLAGLPSDRFLFAGFLPVKETGRADMLAELGAIDATLVFYESAGRLLKSLDAIDSALPGRRVGVARELTKMHEECRVDTPAALIAHYEAKPPRGEIVLLVEPPQETEASEADVDALLRATPPRVTSDPVNNLAKVDPVPPQFQRAGIDTGNREQIAHHLVEHTRHREGAD